MSLDEDLPTHSNTFPIGPPTAGTEKLEAATRELGSSCSCWWTGTTDTEEGERKKKISLNVMARLGRQTF